MIKPVCEGVRDAVLAGFAWLSTCDAVRATLRRLREREPWWGELFSGLACVGAAVLSWGMDGGLEQHPVIGQLAQLVGGSAIIVSGLVLGAGQVASLVTDSWPWRWVCALFLTAWWSIPVVQVFQTGAQAPVLAAACAGWAAVNAASAWVLVRRKPGQIE